VFAESSASLATTPEKIIIDTDIGTDIDDAFAVALALRSPEFDILGITTASGDTEARAKILDRMPPVLFDAMTFAFLLDPPLCPVRPMHIRVDDTGLTRVTSGASNAQVYLYSDAAALFRFYITRLLAP
jgi:inosine-uridine nucleoside N-ribohydrolase